MSYKYMVCNESSKALKGVFWRRQEAVQFARKCACPQDGLRPPPKRFPEMFLVLELHDDGEDVLLKRF